MSPPTAAEIALLKAKAKKVRDKVSDYAPAGGPFAVMTRHGKVSFQDLVVTTDAEGLDRLEVYLNRNEGGDPHYVIYNPPINVRQQDGSLVEDPVLAVAELLTKHGGRQKGRKGR